LAQEGICPGAAVDWATSKNGPAKGSALAVAEVAARDKSSLKSKQKG
jgi:hypothetical protein